MALFQTGDSYGTAPAFFVLPLDNSEWAYSALQNALLLLTAEGNWEQVGLQTVQQAALLFSAMYRDQFMFPDPVGMIVPYGGDPSSLPPTALLCDGSSYATTLYPALFGVIGYAYGGSGANFNVPDLRARFPAGAGGSLLGNAINLGSVGGSESHAQTIGELASHSHTDTGHVHGYVPAVPNITTIGAGAPQPTAVPGAATTAPGAANITSTGGGAAMPTVPPYQGVNFIIITGKPS